MTTRKTITAAMMREMLIQQSFEEGRPIVCPLCREDILPGDRTIAEHLHALGLGGSDTHENRRLVHWLCAEIKTNGTKATTAGSDKNRMAKHRRLTGKNKPKRKQKIQSRGFDRSRTRKVDGTVVRRV